LNNHQYTIDIAHSTCTSNPLDSTATTDNYQQQQQQETMGEFTLPASCRLPSRKSIEIEGSVGIEGSG
jgi:hypothetical protein